GAGMVVPNKSLTIRVSIFRRMFTFRIAKWGWSRGQTARYLCYQGARQLLFIGARQGSVALLIEQDQCIVVAAERVGAKISYQQRHAFLGFVCIAPVSSLNRAQVARWQCRPLPPLRP